MANQVYNMTIKTNIPSWKEKYPSLETDILNLKINDSWKEFFNRKDIKNTLIKINQFLTECIKNNENIYPYPDLLFNGVNTTDLDNIKVVIIGQDPYFNSVNIKGKSIPQATGLSFSVPDGVAVPPSLNNIFLNQKKYGLITDIPKSGDLTRWANQGCLMLNTTLTVKEKHPNSHEAKWRYFSDELIKYISEKTNNTVFLIFGGPSLKKVNLIDNKKHKIIISSHPSPLAARQKLKEYNSFVNTNHFGECNEYLVKNGKQQILW